MAMTTEALEGGFDDAPRQAARAFRAVMEAMARPGEARQLADTARAPAPASPAAATLLLVLCDPGTPVHLAGAHDTPALRDWITFHCGAPLVAADEAEFALGAWSDLLPLERFRPGEPDYPDRSATLIVDGAPELNPVSLSGPGIRSTRAAELPAPVLLQANAARFPLGLDFCFCEGATLRALPRSTRIAAADVERHGEDA